MEKGSFQSRTQRILQEKRRKHKTKGTKLATAAMAAAVTASTFALGAKEINAATGSYIVQKGDTLYRISKNYDVTVEELQSINNLKSDKIYTGQSLKVSPKLHQTDTSLQHAAVYTAVAGDTLWDIAKRFGMTIAELKKINSLKSDMVLINQQLIVMENVEVKTAKITGAADNFTVEFQAGNHYFTLKVPYGTAVDYQRLSGKNVLVAYKNGALINIKE